MWSFRALQSAFWWSDRLSSRFYLRIPVVQWAQMLLKIGVGRPAWLLQAHKL